MPKKLRFQVLLDEDQLIALRAREAETGAPVSAQVRLALAAWLKPPVVPKKKTRRA